jgi:hypothetical protein
MTSLIKEHSPSTPANNPFGLITGPSQLGEHSVSPTHPDMGRFQLRKGPGTTTSLVRQSDAGQLLARTFPKGLIIPTQHEIAEADRWFQYVTDWKEPDERRGLLVALKDWDESWYTGRSHMHLASCRNNRRIITEEYIHK